MKHSRRADDDSTRVEFYRKGHDVAQGAGENPEKVAELLGNALLGSDEEILHTLARMRALLNRLEDWENWFEVAESEVTMHTESDLVVGLLLEMGEVCRSHFNDLPRALDYFQQAYDTDSGCLEALRVRGRFLKPKRSGSRFLSCFRLSWKP